MAIPHQHTTVSIWSIPLSPQRRPETDLLPDKWRRAFFDFAARPPDSEACQGRHYDAVESLPTAWTSLPEDDPLDATGSEITACYR
jgi:hypothetical protein